MTADRPADYLLGLVRELCKLPRETEWAEFKENDAEPETLGEYISALANSAALAGKAFAYLVWGVRDDDHAVVGTAFAPGGRKVGNEELENWLLRALAPKIHFRFFEVAVDSLPVVLLEIERAYRQPVQFKGQEFIRVGTYKKRLKDFPEKERALWRLFDTAPFESGVAMAHQPDDAVLRLLDYPAYFDLLERPLPENRAGILATLADDKLIAPCPAGGWDISNLGAILFAKRLDDFAQLKRKAMRVIQYQGNSRVETLREWSGAHGYACGFAGLVDAINGLLPASEVIERAFRHAVPVFPELAVRELVVNALIHQDFFVTGAGPMVEIFDNRLEITNPGEPLVDARRFVDTPPKSRNDGIASLMRRFRICEERGSGIDKVIFEVESHQLPAPLFETPEGFTRVVLFAHKPLTEMDKNDRIRACYLHACLKWVGRECLTNASLRERFGIEEKNKSAASRYIRETVEAGMIRPFDEEASRKHMKYVPYWA
jgi:predicted HTH transcriptional regulator